ncbi:predicted protein [Sclerotinia sclerotiorum 1980 UF-70]|uniref:Uncharacterized protein n=1 Tax=Sclerotinia sclerotiorum (strain ATCC 18683 / 1980 / Ss-1) TaxID=665079 RepID=A7F6W2_SCLS1|nr:predicted protein [Sclerotinia sclerotiorum 1980 UF-70]EDN98483.1 predicted protein [Sclerotinia sclerotiorum 1980 UF-70]
MVWLEVVGEGEGEDDNLIISHLYLSLTLSPYKISSTPLILVNLPQHRKLLRSFHKALSFITRSSSTSPLPHPTKPRTTKTKPLIPSTQANPYRAKPSQTNPKFP